MQTSEIIKLVITVVSALDFIIFIAFFSTFIVSVTVKAFQTKKYTVIFISICVLFIFMAYKALHVPIFIISLPENWNVKNVPGTAEILFALTIVNLIMAVIPLVLAIYSVVKTTKTKNIKKYKTNVGPKINIIMPIYNENPESLYRAIISVTKLDYYLKNIHLYLAFDDLQTSEAFTYIIKKFGCESVSESVITIDIEGVLISICRFKHGGKKSAQYSAFKLIEQQNNLENLKKTKIFFIDSDIVLHKDSLAHLIYYSDTFKKNCVTGMISCINSCNNGRGVFQRFLGYYQDIEYISGQIFWRNFETTIGRASTCLPGAFTLMDYNSLKKVSKQYFETNDFNDIFDYHRFYLGEDRFLTHLLMESGDTIGFCEAARCKTDAPSDLTSLLKQRRRWALGHISNDTWMMSSPKLWKKYLLLSVFNFLNNARNSSLYVYLLYFVLLLNQNVNLYMYLGIVVLPVALNWLFVVIYAFKIRRKMNILFYFCILFIQPLVSMMYLYYTIWTVRRIGWGSRNKSEENKLTEIVVTN